MRNLLGRSRGIRILNVTLIVLVLGAATAAIAAAGRDDTEDRPPPSAEVERGVVVSTVSADGNVEPPSDLSLGFETGGEVTAVAVEEGDRIARGQLLARIDDRSARSSSPRRSRASTRRASAYATPAPGRRPTSSTATAERSRSPARRSTARRPTSRTPAPPRARTSSPCDARCVARG
ncbi:MAG: biotin/lipoyl-binding protein [Thermoleophilaceae bacterium]